MNTQHSTFTLRRVCALALLLVLLAGMAPTPNLALAAEAEPVEITPGLQAAIDAVLGPEMATTPTQEAKLNASDPGEYDSFGGAVAVSGDTALVGVHSDDDDGTDSGSAYIFYRNQGGADSWDQVAKLTASDAAASHFFNLKKPYI